MKKPNNFVLNHGPSKMDVKWDQIWMNNGVRFTHATHTPEHVAFGLFFNNWHL